MRSILFLFILTSTLQSHAVFTVIDKNLKVRNAETVQTVTVTSDAMDKNGIFQVIAQDASGTPISCTVNTKFAKEASIDLISLGRMLKLGQVNFKCWTDGEYAYKIDVSF